MLLWERLEEELALIIRDREDWRRDRLEARVEAALVVVLLKSLTWPALDGEMMKSGLDSAAWVEELGSTLQQAILTLQRR